MRHLGSLFAALVVAPAAWILLAFGQAEFVWGNGSALPGWPERVLALAAAGLLLGLVATTRISPLGPLVAGAAFTGYGVAALWRRDVYDAMPDTVTIAERQADLHAPVTTGTAVVVGVLLMVAALSVRRWQRWPKRPAAPAPATAPGPAEPPAGAGDEAWTRPDSTVEPARAGALIAAAAASDRRPSPRHAAPDEPDHEAAPPEPPTGPSTVDREAPGPESIDAGLSSGTGAAKSASDRPTSIGAEEQAGREAAGDEPAPSGVRPFPGLSRLLPAPGQPGTEADELPERAESTSPAGQPGEPEGTGPEPAEPEPAEPEPPRDSEAPTETPSEPTKPRSTSPWAAPPRQHPT